MKISLLEITMEMKKFSMIINSAETYSNQPQERYKMSEAFIFNFCNILSKTVPHIEATLKAQNLLEIRRQLNEVRRELGAVLSSKDPLREELRNEVFERYYNVYDTACAIYYGDGVDREIFKKIFSSEIKSLIEDVFTKGVNVESYPYIVKFLEEEK